MRAFAILFSIFAVTVRGDDCHSCVNSGGSWCEDASFGQCQNSISNCTTKVKDSLNCPRSPSASYDYDENFARYIATPFLAGVYAADPTPCLRNQVPTAQLYQNIHVQCRNGDPNSTCHAYVAFDVTQKSIIVVFEGTNGQQQWIDEISSFFIGKKPFFDNGHVYAYFYNAFYYLWNGGLEAAVRSLKYLYPDYELWAFGHSLGASICTVFASHTVRTSLWAAEKVKLLTFGQPRTGDKQFSEWHDNTFLYSYRVVHKQDPVPHVPPLLGPDEVFHHRYEVWYNNDMKLGDSYQLCQEADGPYCSNTQEDTVWEDHVIYFDRSITEEWANSGCPNML